jgi:purine-binding chemotaxis protein CheW
MTARNLHEKTTGAPLGAPVVFSGLTESALAERLNAGRTIEKFVVFFLNSRCYGIAAQSVAEVSRPLAVAALPRSPERLAGVANLRGEIIPVLNSSKILSEAAEKSASATKFIILRAKIFSSLIALPVDRLSEIVAFGDEEFGSAIDCKAAFIVGEIAYRTTILRLIDAERMLGSIAFD